MLVVRAVDDEASLALAAGAIANRLSTLTGWGIAYVMMVLVAGLRVAGFNSNTLLGWLEVGYFGVAKAVFIVLLASGICKATHGEQMLCGLSGSGRPIGHAALDEGVANVKNFTGVRESRAYPDSRFGFGETKMETV